jgi:hypothetical protein
MTQSKAKSEQDRISPIEEVYRLIGQCSSDALEELVKDVTKLLWLRKEVKRGEDGGPGIPAEKVFAELKERYENK